MIGDSQEIAQLRRIIGRVGPANSRVLISGPGGSGKEIVAREIHESGARAGGPFVVVNCASLQPERLNDLLFGAAAGVPGEGEPGLFVRADGGTLLLDEVADTPLATQSRFIRILQDQRLERPDGHGPVELDVRIIATSNRDLRAAIRDNTFREELFYRLSVVPIAVPSLAERREDIPALANYLMDRASASAGLPKRILGGDALTALQACPWPGNVRHLRNVIDWLLIMAPGGANDLIRADMLPADIISTADVETRAVRRNHDLAATRGAGDV